MRIAVCVKPVPLMQAIDLETRRLDRSGPSVLTGVDESAVEAALMLRDALGDEHGSEVVVVSMVPAAAAEALRPALAMGADRAVVVTSDAVAGSDLLATSDVLVAALRQIGPDLVVLGAASGDGNGAMLWSAIGERLGWPVLSRAAEVSVAEGRVRLTRQTETGSHLAEAALPAVLALSGETCVPRYPSFKDVVAAKRKQVELVGADELGVPASALGVEGSRTRVVRVEPAPRRGRAELVEDDGHAHEHVVAFLRERRLV